MGLKRVSIDNPWARRLHLEVLARIRENSKTVSGKVLQELLAENPQALDGLGPDPKEIFQEVVFATCCRVCVMDGDKPFSLAVLNKHLQPVMNEACKKVRRECSRS